MATFFFIFLCFCSTAIYEKSPTVCTAGLYIIYSLTNSVLNALHTNSCLHLAKVKVIKVICKAKSMHCLFVFNYATKVTLFWKT